ncbi:hypothetical protein R1T43_11270 [Alteromonas sp. CI.11.F.A3]|uniref:hypothetical protein n=1 Tax=Alteromonas sp. CI.11.F.A3 TaxID=3079555 RepID=UPI002941CCC1|nr:hypothetical protein [Alteromonas sp. CI.11.F.A3]WOI35807.1 hypothetical protein R1T43_11270 [Alteromonas sp. CI.11.F.A3]
MKKRMITFLFSVSYLRTLLNGVFAFTCLLFSFVTNAHVVEETTAQIILRDGQVEIRMQTDRAHWVAAVSDSAAFLVGDIDNVMPTGLSIKAQDSFFKSVLQKQTILSVNTTELAIDGVKVIENQNSQKMTAIMYATHTFSKVENIGVSFPRSLGKIHSSFSRPQYRTIPAGGYGSITLE